MVQALFGLSFKLNLSRGSTMPFRDDLPMAACCQPKLQDITRVCYPNSSGKRISELRQPELPFFFFSILHVCIWTRVLSPVLYFRIWQPRTIRQFIKQLIRCISPETVCAYFSWCRRGEPMPPTPVAEGDEPTKKNAYPHA